MDPKELERLADQIVGKITMPGHAFAVTYCGSLVAVSSFVCPSSYYAGTGQGCPGDNYVCSSSDSFTCGLDADDVFSCLATFTCLGVFDTCSGTYNPGP